MNMAQGYLTTCGIKLIKDDAFTKNMVTKIF